MALQFIQDIQPALELIDQYGATVRLVNRNEFRAIHDGTDPDTVGVVTKGFVDKVSDFLVATGNADAGSFKITIRNDHRLISTQYEQLYLTFPEKFDLGINVGQQAREQLSLDGEAISLTNPDPKAGTSEALTLNSDTLQIETQVEKAYKDISTRIIPGAHIRHRGQWFRVMNIMNFEVGDEPIMAFELVVGRQGR